MKKPKQIFELEKYWAIEIEKFSINENGHISEIFLDGKNRIVNISPLKELKHLTEVNISRNRISDLNPLQELKQLTKLNLHDNFITDINPLKELKQLTEINISRNRISDLNPLQELKQLTKLNIHNNFIVDINPLKDLKQLTEINASNNRISDLNPIQKLESLTKLNLNQNKINDLQPLQQLKHLIQLYLQYNQINNLSPLQELKQLKALNISNNKINDLTPLKEVKELIELNISENQITNLISLKDLIQLKELNVSKNQISDLNPLKNLIQLINLNVSENQITDINPLKQLLEMGVHAEHSERYYPNRINLYKNPLISPPIKIIRKGNRAILDWFDNYDKEQAKGKRPLNEVKMVLIGEPEAGKTSLINYLLGKPFVKHKTTEGVKIERWSVQEGETLYRINVWDFGGQEIQSTVHQFFLTQDTLYVVVLNARQDETPDKYLEQIKSFAPNSPVIVVINRMDENAAAAIDEKRLRQIYTNTFGQPILQAVHKISLLKGHDENHPIYLRELQALRNDIITTLMRLPNIRKEVPITYFDVKAHLESEFFKEIPYITHDTYEEICANNNLEKASNNDLLTYLNILGTVRYFDDLKTRHLHILNPEWLSDGVYRILIHPKTHSLKGIIKEIDFGEILQKSENYQFEYPRQYYNYLIEMIRQFHLGYFDELTKQIFIPKAFRKDYPDNFIPDDYKNDAIHFFFKYETFIPSSLISSFISQVFKDVKDALYWQNGIVIVRNMLDEVQTALIEQTDLKNRIDIWVQGVHRREFFIEIRKIFRDFHIQRRGLVVDEMVGLDNRRNISVKYKVLIAHKFKSKRDYTDDEGNDYDIDKLLGMFESNILTNQYITQNYGTTYDMRGAYNIRIFHQQAREISDDLEFIRRELTESNQLQIQSLIDLLAELQKAETPKKAKGVLAQLKETAKNLPKIASEEAVKWATKTTLDGVPFSEKFDSLKERLLNLLQQEGFQDWIKPDNLV